MKKLSLALVLLSVSGVVHADTISALQVSCTSYSPAEKKCSATLNAEDVNGGEQSLGMHDLETCGSNGYSVNVSKGTSGDPAEVAISMTRTSKNIFGKVVTKVLDEESVYLKKGFSASMSFSHITNDVGMSCQISTIQE